MIGTEIKRRKEKKLYIGSLDIIAILGINAEYTRHSTQRNWGCLDMRNRTARSNEQKKTSEEKIKKNKNQHQYQGIDTVHAYPVLFAKNSCLSMGRKSIGTPKMDHRIIWKHVDHAASDSFMTHPTDSLLRDGDVPGSRGFAIRPLANQ